MNRKLKIYACSGIGNGNSRYSYWLDNTQTVSNTQAVNSLLSMINLNYSEVQNLGLTTSEVVERLNQIDLYSVAIYYAQVYHELPDDLHRAGQVIGCLLDRGVFDYNSLSNEERDKHLDEVFEKVADVITDDTLKASSEFTKWWKRIVEDRNKVGLSVEEQNAINSVLSNGDKEAISGDDWRNNKDLAEYLDNASEYFLYTYFTDEQLKSLRQVFRAKKMTQLKTYNYCKAMYVGVYGSETEMQNVIRAGIIRDFKETPEKVCAEIVAGTRKVKGVGDLAAILTAVATLLVAVVQCIIMICKAVAEIKVAKYQVDIDSAAAATPNEEDFNGIGDDDSTSSSVSKKVLLVAAAAAFLIFNNN